MTHEAFGPLLTVKTLVRVAFFALSVSSIGVAKSQPSSYHTPAHNYYQNNWMSDTRR
jgi:hypothetical protein